MAESIQRLKERLSKLLHQKDLAAQKASLLEAQTERDRQREQMLTGLTHQLMDRQRELNIMLNRANIMLNRAQEANTILSLEFTELCHALPAPEAPEVQDRIRRINDLFKTTGISDAEVASAPGAPDSVIVTPPPEESQPVAEPPFEVIEEVESMSAGGDGKRASRTADARLDDLFRRTGSDDGATTPDAQAETSPAQDVISEPAPESESPPSAFASQFTGPRLIDEPLVDFSEPIVLEESQFTAADEPVDDGVAEPERIGMASSGSGHAAAPGRRWWRLLGRR
ncbi:MAG: hypothetical protein Q7T82_07070 [Armatimonadota bacterium]|nr:hypothetical protein [Armatimonadota bacterium]